MEQHPSLGKAENGFDLQHGLQVPGVLHEAKSNFPRSFRTRLTLVRSSLILTHGRPLIDASLMTMLSALLFSFP